MSTSPGRQLDTAMKSRMTTLAASVVAALCAGTNYSFSAYAPQLGSRLGISHTKLNMIGLAGNYGAHISGPIWGRLIDRNGPRLVLLIACGLLFSGYYGTKVIFDLGVPSGSATISATTTFVLVLFKAMTGSGGNAGFSAGMNSTAKSFSASLRATTVGIVASGFGLSALLFSSIARIFLAGNTSSFLSLLAFGTSIPMVIGSFFIKIIPAEAAKPAHDFNAVEMGDEEEEPLLTSNPVDVQRKEEEANIYGSQLARNLDFWLIFTIMSLLAGSGLTYINNVGSMARALYAQGNPGYDPRKADIWQGSQVSALSFMNFSGRLLIGPISDLARSRFGLPRSYSMIPIAGLLLCSQLTVLGIDHVESLWIASSMLGAAYGSIYALFPNVCIEWFGMPHFSENWGYVALSPIISSNVFAMIFGRIMDAHNPKLPEHETLLSNAAQCLEGRKCYSDALYYTSAGCLLALLLSIWAAYRDRRRIVKVSRD